MKRFYILCLCCLFLAACAAPAPTLQPTPTLPPGVVLVPTTNNSGIPQLREQDHQPAAVQGVAQALSHPTDFSHFWWPEGWQGALREAYMMTGTYGLSLSPLSGSITRLGTFSSPCTQAQALAPNNAAIAALPKLKMNYSVAEQGVTYPFTRVVGVQESPSNNSRLLESGRLLQRADILGLRFQGREQELCGRLEVLALPDYCALQFEINSQQARLQEVTLTFTLQLDPRYVKSALSQDGTIAALADETGAGFCFVAAKGDGVNLSLSGTTLTVQKTYASINRNTFTGLGLRIAPRAKVSLQDAYELQLADDIFAKAVTTSPQAGTDKPVTLDKSRGLFTVALENMFTKTEGQLTDADLNTYDGLSVTLTNNGSKAVRVPLAFWKEDPLNVTGTSPMLVNPDSGEPLGIPVQYTRNWHFYSAQQNSGYEYADRNSPKRFWEGRWFHAYTLVTVPAHSTVRFGYQCAFGQWGSLYAASHSQLCLAGWGGNLQQWESSSLGAFGESFCYDIARSLTLCNMGDICAAALYSRVDGKKYNWTGNIGGGDFLGYFNKQGKQIQLAGMKTYFKSQGPNLTEVQYAGTTADGAIRVEITVNMGRTDDSAHAIHTIHYTWLKDTSFSRLYFYQMSADSYNYDYWPTMAVGNNNGLAPFTLGGRTYNGLLPVPISSNNAYVGGITMNQASVPGEGMWLAYIGAEAGKSMGNKVLAVHRFYALLNGVAYDKPAFSVRTTNVLQWKGAIFELNPPKEAGDLVKAGSTLSMVLDYITLPAHKTDYYGPSTVLAAVPAADYENEQLVYRYATNLYTVPSATVGEVLNEYPAKIKAAGQNGTVAASLTLTGGLGYMPLTFTNLPSPYGWRLEVNTGAGFAPVEQAVKGNDYWQTVFDADTGTYELTYNVFQNGREDARQYRLVKAG